MEKAMRASRRGIRGTTGRHRRLSKLEAGIVRVLGSRSDVDHCLSRPLFRSASDVEDYRFVLEAMAHGCRRRFRGCASELIEQGEGVAGAPVTLTPGGCDPLCDLRSHFAPHLGAGRARPPRIFTGATSNAT